MLSLILIQKARKKSWQNENATRSKQKIEHVFLNQKKATKCIDGIQVSVSSDEEDLDYNDNIVGADFEDDGSIDQDMDKEATKFFRA